MVRKGALCGIQGLETSDRGGRGEGGGEKEKETRVEGREGAKEQGKKNEGEGDERRKTINKLGSGTFLGNSGRRTRKGKHHKQPLYY